MSVLRPLVALAAAALLLPGATPATNQRDFRWTPLIRVHGPHDVVGPRADGRLVIATSRGLFLYRRGGRATPFARGEGGHVPVLGENYSVLARDHRLPAAGCRFRRDDLYVLDPMTNPSVIKVDKRGRATRLVSFPGALLAGITFDQVGRFGSRLLVAARIANELTLYGVDCRAAQVILERGPQVEGGIAVAPRSFGAFGGRLVAADELSGNIYAFDQRGGHTLLASSGLPGGTTSASRASASCPRASAVRRVRTWLTRRRPARRRKGPTASSPSQAPISCVQASEPATCWSRPRRAPGRSGFAADRLHRARGSGGARPRRTARATSPCS